MPYWLARPGRARGAVRSGPPRGWKPPPPISAAWLRTDPRPRAIDRAAGTVLFATAAVRRKPHAEDMRVIAFLGDLVYGAMMLLAVPIAILAVGLPVALVVRVLLSTFGLL
jgi:hypothetical protein